MNPLLITLIKHPRMALACGWILATIGAAPLQGAEKLKALIIDGQNNHDWVATTPVLKRILEDSGRFNVDVSTSPDAGPPMPSRPKNATPADEQAHDHHLRQGARLPQRARAWA
jgi:hypothetical protein